MNDLLAACSQMVMSLGLRILSTLWAMGRHIEATCMAARRGRGSLNYRQAEIPKTQWEESWVPVFGGKVFTRMAGSPSLPSIVLVHGFVLASDYMMPIANTLSPWCRVYAIDFPGYGRSDKPSRRLELSYLADCLGEWMDRLKLSTAQFVANSFGCQILAEFAVHYAHHVERLVLQGPTVDPEARTLFKQILRLLKNSRIESPGLGRMMVRDYWRAGWRGIVDTARMALTDQVETKLPQIKVPTLVVRGSHDVLVSEKWAERMVQLLPRGELLIMPGLAHTINYTAPAEFVNAIRSFLHI